MTTWPTEDAAMRRFAAAWADNGGCGRDRLVTDCHHLALDARNVEILPVEVPLGVVEQPLGLAVFARDTGERDPRALPQLVVVDLRHRRAKAVLQLSLH